MTQQGIFERESAVAAHARRLGCTRDEPLTGLCVNCPIKARGECTVPRVNIILWTARITQDVGNADATIYLNELATSTLTLLRRSLAGVGKKTSRETAIEVRCGDLFVDPDALGDVAPEAMSINLPTYIHDHHGIEYEACRHNVVMDAKHLRHLQVSNYGRKAIIAVQCCSRDCAERLAGLVNRNWQLTTGLLRSIRPLK